MGQIMTLASVPAVYPDRTAGLDTAECTFLAAVRWWVSGYRGDEDPVPRLCQGLKIAGVRDAHYSSPCFWKPVRNSCPVRCERSASCSPRPT